MEESQNGTPPTEEENAPSPAQAEDKEQISFEETAKAEEEAEKREQEKLDATDGEEFAARYHSAKERDMQKLSEEMEARSAVKTKKQKIKTAVKTICMILLIGLSVGIMFGLGDYLGGDETKSFSEMLHECFNWRYFLLFIAVILAYIFFESLKYAYLLKISTGKWRLKNSIKTMFLGKYYDGITPLGTGGQPFQIYYLHKRNVPAGVATAVPLVKYIVTTFVFGLIAIVLLALTPAYFRDNEKIHSALSVSLMVVAWISLFFNLSIPAIMIILSAFPKVGKKMIVGLVKLLSKMHIVKHRYSVTKKYVYEVAEYRNALKLLIQKWWMLIPLIFITLIESMLYITLPFFAVISVAGVAPTWSLLVQIWCLAMVSFFSASLVPTPGNSGASETASSFVFATVTGIESVIGWVILSWRFSTFYLYIVVGVCMSIFSMIRDAVRARRARRKA